MGNKIERKCLCGFFEVPSVNFVYFFLLQGRVTHLSSQKNCREDTRPTQTEAETVSVKKITLREEKSNKVSLSLQKKCCFSYV